MNHRSPATSTGLARFRLEVRDAVSWRTAALVAGVLALQLGFILSYVGAFHAPRPHDVTLGVVAGPRTPALVGSLDALAGHPLDARALSSASQARHEVVDGRLSGALVLGPARTDRLTVASGGGVAVAESLTAVVTRVEDAAHRRVAVIDAVPLQQGDARGLTGFYLVVGWLVGGYLAAALLGVARGSRPANEHRALIRLLALALYAGVSGLGGAIVVGPVLGALTGHTLALWGLGTLVVAAAAAVTVALQTLAGVVGIGLAVALFVVLGNPSAGGAYQSALLPPFWRALGGALPNGAGVDAVRRLVYFAGRGASGDLAVLALYAAAGAAVSLISAGVLARRPSRS
ncbi:MAG: DUF3533 domain-containing protein [Acidimicrobiales bacterium]